MGISEMKLVSIIGLIQDLSDVVRVCGKSEIFHPDNVFSFYSNTEKFIPLNSEENPYSKIINKIMSLVKGFGFKLKMTDISDFDADENQIAEYVDHISEKMGELAKERRDLLKESKKHKDEISKIQKFKGLDTKINDLLSCEYVKVRFGKLPKESFEKLSFYSAEEDIMFFPCTSDSVYFWGIYFAPLERVNQIDRIFSGLYFENIEIERFEGTIEDRISDLESKFEEIKNKISDLDKKINLLWQQHKGQCMRVYSKLRELETFYSIRKFAARYNESFILVGWIPAENEREFCGKLSEINGVEYSTETGRNILGHSPPVRLKNSKLFKPFEFFIDTYGLPSYDEIDPTVFVSLTYTLLFGIMFADLGQGLVVSILGYILWKLKGFKLGAPLVVCGISSAFFGTLFGSVFGYENLLDSFYKSTFGLQEKPIDIMDSKNIETIIYSAVVIGVLLMIIAMIINIYSLFRRQRIGDAIFGQNGISGLVLYISSVVLLLDSVVFNLRLTNTVNILVFIVIPLVFIMFGEVLGALLERKSNWRPENWADYFIQGIFELFEIVLSYITNTMSFLRVGAFVLVHGGMMMVVFTVANMSSGIGYFLVVLLGNVFVICLEVLLAGIQVLRLEFYEMFNRFFEGQGRPFRPVVLSEKTYNDFGG